ncbi:Lrp/AsnC family transcriptional regulator [Maribacter sp. IgM3_T14_3]|uniref:Lrp/AsnC family transcriptional regulator n=1 Tax=Maribacter sp. IgM3_T14_3 TaxID=3415140 RepID=UPI003C70091B
MVKDDFDWKIIQLLQNNSRLSYAKIGREINLSPSAVAERVQRLEEENVIEKHITIINPKEIGYSLSAYITMGFNDNGYKPFLKTIDQFSEIVDCSMITGKDCLIMKVILKDNAHLENLIDRLCKFGNPTTSIVLSEVLNNGSIKIP